MNILCLFSYLLWIVASFRAIFNPSDINIIVLIIASTSLILGNIVVNKNAK